MLLGVTLLLCSFSIVIAVVFFLTDAQDLSSLKLFKVNDFISNHTHSFYSRILEAIIISYD